MGYVLKLIAVIVTITYALRLVNAQSDLLVFAGLGIVGLSVYFFFFELNKIFNHLKPKQ
ncbi:hypothetical protein [Dyadobacter sp. 32]|uniref:hypothetical protein n=1 Tax=Dyadobacter sp. 32 TaxID=538966 RepID=UPI0039C6BEF1